VRGHPQQAVGKYNILCLAYRKLGSISLVNRGLALSGKTL